eukprot:TRINITY_DN2170_c0_g1_i4.p1 TRINITY_DN2170_c0_g1~~TRINITY_DN2170_c0_g1_i4.p1  ORF type:complete len:102 (-),score=4.97 TRINITY_DN2170_c0_g1_i4:387-692(-)
MSFFSYKKRWIKSKKERNNRPKVLFMISKLFSVDLLKKKKEKNERSSRKRGKSVSFVIFGLVFFAKSRRKKEKKKKKGVNSISNPQTRPPRKKGMRPKVCV